MIWTDTRKGRIHVGVAAPNADSGHTSNSPSSVVSCRKSNQRLWLLHGHLPGQTNCLQHYVRGVQLITVTNNRALESIIIKLTTKNVTLGATAAPVTRATGLPILHASQNWSRRQREQQDQDQAQSRYLLAELHALCTSQSSRSSNVRKLSANERHTNQ